ncbi:MAG: hypothetical protein JO358_11130, partial [Alphaproteobacteria bacterium]|nr:hypothetical protein [Alphaproteobacteria bacterium]
MRWASYADLRDELLDHSIGNRLHASALRVWSGFAVAMTLTAVPVFSTVLPPLLDYPNHLARMHLLVEG